MKVFPFLIFCHVEYYNRKEELRKTIEYKGGKTPDELAPPPAAKPKEEDKKKKVTNDLIL